MEYGREKGSPARPMEEKARLGGLSGAFSRAWGRFFRRVLKRRPRWEVTAARLDERTKTNLQRWAQMILASGEETNPRVPVLVALTEEKREVVAVLRDMAQGRWNDQYAP